jgi:putative phosphoribosyl transferase
MQQDNEIGGEEREFQVPIRGWRTISGDLAVPEGAEGLVLFAHGSGSSRFSPRNRYVAQLLRERGLATALVDLLTPAEESIDAVSRSLRFDIRLLTERVVTAVRWLGEQQETSRLRLGCFGGSTGAAAAIAAAARLPDDLAAVVSRGGRPDLAEQDLPRVKAPTLLIVGGDDSVVIDLNRAALEALTCEKHMAIVRGAGHLFEEPGKMEEVADLAGNWFAMHLITHPVAGRK